MRIARLCKEFGTLPNPGGLLQQPTGVVMRLEAALDASARYDQVEMEKQKH